jgi:hypothetical protein
MALVLTLLLFGPGYLVERRVRVFAQPAMLVRPAIWLGLSLSLIALLYEWATTIGLALTLPILAALAGLCAIGVIWALWRDLHPFTLSSRHLVISSSGHLLALLAVFALTLWTRFMQIRDLALPPWVDSVHHALMIRVAAEGGLAPYSLRPYLPVDDIPYHWGYHVLIATLMRLSGADLPWAMLWSGQILNALQVLAVAALAAYLWRRPQAGIIAGLVVGLLSIMPAYYLSWGRYTQLTGLLLLPPAAIIWDAGLRSPSRRLAVYLALVLAGLSIVHFRILIFTLGLLGAIGLVWAAQAERRHLRARLGFALASAVVAVGLALPWLWLIARRALAPAFQQPALQLGEGSYNALNDGLLWAGDNRILIALALAATLWGIRRRARPALEQLIWVALLVLLANPWLATYLLPAAGAALVLHGALDRRPLPFGCGLAMLLLNPALVRLPYLYLIPNDVVVISLFLPIAVMLGGGGALLVEWLARGGVWRRRTVEIGTAVVFSLVALGGAWKLRDVVNPSTVLATRADLDAITWAAEHTPADARFLINAQPWLPGVERGGDGGWWLTPLAARWTSTPPALFVYGTPDDVRAVRERAAAIARLRPGQERELLELLERERITHVYLSARSGPLTPEMFADRRIFQPIYGHDGVTILAVHR